MQLECTTVFMQKMLVSDVNVSVLRHIARYSSYEANLKYAVLYIVKLTPLDKQTNFAAYAECY